MFYFRLVCIRDKYIKNWIIIIVILIALFIGVSAFPQNRATHSQFSKLIADLETDKGASASIRLALYSSKAIPTLKFRSKSPLWRARYWSVAALGMIPNSLNRSEKERYLKDKDWRVRISTILALRKTEDSSDIELLETLAKHEINPNVLTFIGGLHTVVGISVVKRLVYKTIPTEFRVDSLPIEVETNYFTIGEPSNGLLLMMVRHFLHSEFLPDWSVIHVFHTSHGRLEKSNLEIPKGWSPDLSSGLVRLLSKHHNQVILAILHDDRSGTAERLAPAFYRLEHMEWKLTNANLKPYQFSNYGGFRLYPNQRRLDVWEVENYKGFRRDPHRYNMSTFVWSHSRFYKISRRLTRKKYVPMEVVEKGKRILPENDPLREFGRRWRWWQNEF